MPVIVGGTAGCNKFTANDLADGDSMRFARVAVTRMACPDPAILDEEMAFHRALELVTTLRFENDRIDLLREDGSIAIILVRNP